MKALLFTALFGMALAAPAAELLNDPCAGLNLPPCPPACEPATWELHGKPCEGEEGYRCGNSIGDGMSCYGGRWEISIHAPLGMGCNAVCRG